MSYSYKYETFRSESANFDKEFSQYLNERGGDGWKVKHCNYCNGSQSGKLYASCLFEQKT